MITQDQVDQLVTRIRAVRRAIEARPVLPPAIVKAYVNLRDVYKMYADHPDVPTFGIMEGCLIHIEKLLKETPGR